MTDQDRDRAQGATDCEGTHIAHEEFGGGGVEPEETQTASDQCATEYGELPGPGYVLDGQVIGDVGMAGRVGEARKGSRSNHDRADGQSVEPVGQVDTITESDDHEGGEWDVEPPEVRRKVFEEGYGEFLIESGARVDCAGDPQGEEGLPEELRSCRYPIAIAQLDLLVVVDESQHPVPRGEPQHNPYEVIGQVRPEQHRDRQREKDQQSTHGGGASFRLVVGADLADGLTDSKGRKFPDQPGTDHERDEEGGQCRSGGSEGDVPNYVEATERTLQGIEQVVEH